MRISRIGLSLLLLFFGTGMFGVETPELEPGNKTILFHLERNRDNNQVYYALNVDKQGRINKTDPISTYWKKEGQPDKQIPLSSLQQKYGYGVKIVSIGSNEVRFYVAAYPDGVFTAKRKDGEYVSLFQAGKKEVTMSKLYVHFKGTSFWNPVILKIDVYGLDAQHKEYLVRELIPK